MLGICLFGYWSVLIMLIVMWRLFVGVVVPWAALGHLPLPVSVLINFSIGLINDKQLDK